MTTTLPATTLPAPPEAAGNAYGTRPTLPLSAAYCAERAAAALAEMEQHGDFEGLRLAAAHAWRKLGLALATNPAMLRPRDPDNGRR